MTDFIDRISKLSPKRLALLALELHEQVEASKQRHSEPVAVIGLGCRFPGGANSPEEFWSLLEAGRDAIREVPRDRWDINAFFDPDPDAPGRMSVRSGGFLDDISTFDAPFFGIAPREALSMDPQQRLLLEVAWEALEHAGISADRIVGSSTGVFVGICNSDHFQRLLARGAEDIDAYLASGSAHSVAAGRISYCLGLHGPALAIDTACSSSLVALHAACQSLRNRETHMALSGGVNLMCSPETTIALSKAHMLAPDGRCKTFDASADGFSRGEGCGVLVLKRLEDALADEDRILAVIRGTATNQDGRSGGLTVPSGPAQEAVIRAALADAHLEPAAVDYVEAHGTGTSLGDPIEVRALAAALGDGRDVGHPLIIGSVKTNIGHLESAAGIAGVIKVILSLQHERIPAHLHFQKPSPHISWSEFPVTVSQRAKAWPRSARPRIGGVSSFGFSGTNAHVLVEEAPLLRSQREALRMPVQCLPLSARSDPALAQIADRYAVLLASDRDAELSDIAKTAGAGRAHFTQRLAIVANSAEAAHSALQAHAAGSTHSAVHTGTAIPGQQPEVVFLFPGQGSQYPGMASGLYEASPVFRGVIDQCDAMLGPDRQGRTLKSVVLSPGDDAAIHETAWTQPALFAVEYGVAQLWRSWGVEPAAVIGHSVGEYVAACVAGVFTLENGLRLIAERGRLMGALPPGGRMAAVFAPLEIVAAALAPMSDRVSIAAINSSESVVISGEDAAVEAVLDQFVKRDIRGQKLFISLAAHSPLVDPALDAMEACARGVVMRTPQIPVAWNLTGGEPLASGAAPDADYWRRHLREPVRFADGLRSLYGKGYRTFLDVGPHPTLMALAQQVLPEEDTSLFASLRRDKDDWQEILASLARLYVRGAPVNWAGVHKPYGHRRVALPTYPFERRPYWISATSAGARRRLPQAAKGHLLLGVKLPTAVPVFETVLTPEAPAYLGDHHVHGEALVAGPVFLEMAQACAREAFGKVRDVVKDFVIHRPLVLHGKRVVQTCLGDEVDGAVPFSISSRDGDETGDWVMHVRGRLVDAGTPPSGEASESIAALQRRLRQAVGGDDFYGRLADAGIDLTGRFRSIREAHCSAGEALARIELPPGCKEDAVAWAHPALLDGAMQTCGLATPPASEPGAVYLLTEVESITLTRPLPATLWCHARLRDPATPDRAEWRADVLLRDVDGTIAGEVRGVCLRRASRDTLLRAVRLSGEAIDDLFYRVDWQPVPLTAAAAPLLAGPREIEPLIRERFDELALEHRLAVYDELLPELDRLSVEHIVVALRGLGIDMTARQVFAPPATSSEKLLRRMLKILVEGGVLQKRGRKYEVIHVPPPIDMPSHYDGLLERFGEVDAELNILRRCGSALAEVITGRHDPLQLLFPNGSLAEARKLYVESPFARTYNTAMAEALQVSIAALPEGVRLRVLEIGAGTGGTTTHLLPILESDRVEYTFTDVSPLFLERAAEQFSAHSSLVCKLLDIERDPLAQGFDLHHYDVVIAANVLHATVDLRKAVSHVRSLLAPSGMLFLLEGVGPEPWVDLSFGMTDGWWRFTDTSLRPDYPLISAERWIEVLEEQCFADATIIPGGKRASRGESQQALICARLQASPRRWILIGDLDGVGAALARRLEARGDAVTVVAGQSIETVLPNADEIVYLGALELANPAYGEAALVEKTKELSCDLPLHWLGRVIGTQQSTRVWLVTRGAQPATGSPSAEARWQVPLWGVGRVFALEQPNRWGGLIDLQSEGTFDDCAQTLLTSIDQYDGEDQTAWRDGERFAARLDRAPAPNRSAIKLDPNATYLVTGGFGGVGLLVARWLAERGAKYLALLGRRPDPGLTELREIEAMGTRVIPLAGDLADEAGMKKTLADLAIQAPPLRGIIHAAAEFSSALVGEITSTQIRDTLRAKVDGTISIEHLTRDQPLDFLVLFSSTTALLGASGLAHYAAANLFLDATAQAAVGSCARVLSVNWGTWEAMRLASRESQKSFREAGLEPMPASQAFEALERLLAGADRQAIVARVDWSVLKPLHEARRPRPLLSRLESVRSPVGRLALRKSDEESAPKLADMLAKVSPDARRELIVDAVRDQVAAVLGLSGDESISLEMGLFEMGMDSLMSVELKRRLEHVVQRPLPSTLTFNYPNVSALATFIGRELISAEFNTPDVEAALDLAPQGDDDLNELDDAELEARLAARLESIQ